MRRIPILAASLLLAGCASTRPRTVSEATPDQRAALFDRIKSLEGTWEEPDEHGKIVASSVFTVSSGGSVVREIMFPGSPHEMTNVYHMDGPALVMTHYCAVGNQPRLRGTADHPPEKIVLTCDSVSNLTSPDGSYMGSLTIHMKDKDHIVEEWTSYEKGKSSTMAFAMTRKK